MAELLDPTEIFFTPFEPKLQNRFILYIEGVPAYLVKGAGRPNINFNAITLDHINIKRKVKGKGEWTDISIKLYDPIVPSAAQAVMEWVRLSHESVTGRDGYSDFYKKDLTLHVLGPVGDKIEEWTIKGAFILTTTFGDMDWANDAFVEIGLSLAYDYAILQY